MSLYFPMFVDLSEKNILFIGAGEIAARRVNVIIDFAGRVTVVAPEVHRDIETLARDGRIVLHRRRFSENDLDEADIVLVNTGHAGTDVRIAGMCRRRGITVNAASDESLCDFYFPGIARRDPLVVGVTASGEDHKMAAEATAYFKRLIEKNE
ncbi:MAG: bifunctional precorrin-2 dehydrogenase/sirohydrochlorin ferrochelatase [Mogibacterium sp.]|nr:bifunctional precorrin-2 dehydrogenase/sirohydrochlorin ferrochelatase [Mogibacterium sp.]